MKRICILILSVLFLSGRSSALLCEGCVCDDVREIQRKLAKLGYYSGVCGGVYTPEVTAAVRSYQRDNGIFPDGICTYPTAMSLHADVQRDENEDGVIAAARLIAHVCPDGDRIVMIAVASVVFNRVASPMFPDCAQTVALGLGGYLTENVSTECLRAAYEAFLGAAPYGDILYFGREAPEGAAYVRHGGFVFY